MEKVTEQICPWYEGKTLVEYLDSVRVPERNAEGPLRIPIIDRMKDRGTIQIFGKVESGTVKIGEKVAIMA